ncbi:MAG: DUF3419 family protein [Chitinophagaceae bacterium]
MIYYSHVNEDNRVERQLLTSSGCTTVVAVAGSGERILALMDDEVSNNFYVIDVNEEALFLLQLKLAALKLFSVEEYWRFCGHHTAKKEIRINSFNLLKDKLSPSCKKYWEKNTSAIKRGVLDTGHFEFFLQRVRPSINFFLGKHFQPVLSGGSPNAKRFPKKRWKLLTQVFSWKWIYTLWGNKDVAFVGKDSAIVYIPAALNEIIYKGEASSCFMAHLIFKGHLREMKEKNIPPSLQKDVLQKIKQKLVSSTLHVHYHHTDLLTFINKESHLLETPVFYSVSDILSFETFSYLEQLLTKTNISGNIIVWRAFLRNRTTGESTILNIKNDELQDHTNAESTHMYQVFSIHKRSTGI